VLMPFCWCTSVVMSCCCPRRSRFRLRSNSALTDCSVGRMHPLRESYWEIVLELLLLAVVWSFSKNFK
jgi:hypothetical protein